MVSSPSPFLCAFYIISFSNGEFYVDNFYASMSVTSMLSCGEVLCILVGSDTSPTYPSFLMLHAYFYTICLMFCYTSWHFYVFSGTNLLTSRHSTSSLFSAVFVFQKSYTGNIFEIGRNQSQSPRISPKLLENRRGVGVGPRGAHTPGRRGLAPGCAPYV
jgi:hypothetical protein